MPTPNTITPAQPSRLVGLPDAPVIVDGRIEEDHARDTRTLPSAVRKHLKAASTWAVAFHGKRVAVVCQRGEKLSQRAAAWLRHEGVALHAVGAVQ